MQALTTYVQLLFYNCHRKSSILRRSLITVLVYLAIVHRSTTNRRRFSPSTKASSSKDQESPPLTALTGNMK